MVFGGDGVLYLCEQTALGSGGKIWRISAVATWQSAAPDYEMTVLAVDPRDSKRLVASNPNAFFVESLDGGKTFRSIGGVGFGDSGEIGWTRGLKSMFPSQILFDPVQSDRVWVSQGVGMATLSTSSETYLAEDRSAGIEELCAVSTLCVPGGKTLLSAWDKPFWRVDDLTSYSNEFRYPTTRGKTIDSSFVGYGSYIDFAGDDPRFLVGIVAPSDVSAPGFSTNGGSDWQAFVGTPTTGWGNGGSIACSTRNNIVLLPSNNGIGVYSLNGGATWSQVSLDGVSPTGGFANAFYTPRQNISADKTRPGTFALVYTVVSGDTYSNPLGGVWLSANGGKTWSRILTGVISAGSHDPSAVRAAGLEARQFWQCQFSFVPGKTGELLYTPHADYSSDRLFWSRDDGKSWIEPDPSIRNVRSFGFGKAASGYDRPATYFWGEVSGTEGLYASLDWFASRPRLVTRFPSPMLAKVSCVTGDPDRFGRVYVGTGCAGWLRIELEI